MTGISQIDYLHIVVGHLFSALVIARIAFGVFARKSDLFFKNYLHPIGELIYHMKEMFSQSNTNIHIHNPAGSYMVLTLLTFSTIVFLTGLLIEGVIEFSGVFAFLANEIDNQIASVFQLIHKIFSYTLLGLAMTHISGVLLSSYKSKKNFSMMMINGQIK